MNEVLKTAGFALLGWVVAVMGITMWVLIADDPTIILRAPFATAVPVTGGYLLSVLHKE